MGKVMSIAIWNFSPYNEEIYNKSKHRVMFVGADPNDDKKTNEKLSKKDMGEWFREPPEGHKNQFYQRTVRMLAGVLHNIKDQGIDENKHDGRLVHMRFIDFKAEGGTSKANTKEVSGSVEHNLKEVSKYFTKPYPHYIILVGGHARTTFFKFKKSKHLDYDPRSKVVCMPHPSHSVSYKILDQVSKNDLKSKFRKINEEKLYKWTYKKDGVHSKNWHEVSS
tara:strand:- start:176 stop:841 length:666 start_codon:yes stop_codon:yes gene_type:complete